MFKYAGIFLAGLMLAVAGCSSTAPNKSGGAIPAGWSANGGSTLPPPPPAPTHPQATPVPRHVLPPSTNGNEPGLHFNPLPPVPRPPVTVPTTTWSALSRWATANGTEQPHRIATSPVVSYAIGSSYGVLVLNIGSRDATWNGITIHLGFAPEMVDDEVFVHGLDLEKNLEPLLCEAPEPVPAEPGRTVVLDPGHGGRDTGTISVLDGLPEKTFTLDLAKRLQPLLEARGWRVYLTRTVDMDFALSNRVSFAIAHHADLFVSLHFNSSAPEHKQAGLETYCMTPVGMPSTLTRGYQDIVSRVFPVNLYDSGSLRLALRLHSAILRATEEEDRGVRRARFLGVLQGQKCPAVLIEGGYLSNPAEARLIESGTYRQKLAVAIAGALR